MTDALDKEAALGAAVPEGEPAAVRWEQLAEILNAGFRNARRINADFHIDAAKLREFIAVKPHPAPRPDLERELAEARAEVERIHGLYGFEQRGRLTAEAARAALAADKARLVELIRWAHDTLIEINPSNYSHDDVCEANNASVEVILGLAPTLGEKHGKSDEWWEARAAITGASIPAPADMARFVTDAMVEAGLAAWDGEYDSHPPLAKDRNKFMRAALNAALSTSIQAPADKAEARREALEEAARIADGEQQSKREEASSAKNPTLQQASSAQAFTAGRIATAIRALISKEQPK